MSGRIAHYQYFMKLRFSIAAVIEILILEEK